MRQLVKLSLGLAWLGLIGNLIQCDTEESILVEFHDSPTATDEREAVVTVLPSDTIQDHLIDPASRPFNYEMVRSIPITINVKAAYGSSTMDPKHAVIITIHELDSGDLVWRGALGEAINKTMVKDRVIVHQDWDRLEIRLDGSHYKSRSVKIENLPAVESIDREMSIEYTPYQHNLTDTDADAIPDAFDAQPSNANVSFAIDFPPADGVYTVMVEDLFPNLGDYDFNDWVANYKTTESRNAEGDIVGVEGYVDPIARGAGYDHTFVLNYKSQISDIPVTQTLTSDQQSNTTQRVIGDEGSYPPSIAMGGSFFSSFFSHALTGQGIVLFPFGVPIFTSTKQAFGNLGGFDNTEDCSNLRVGTRQQFQLQFAQPIAATEFIGGPADPVLVVLNTLKDVHMIGQRPLPLLGQPADTSFADPAGRPWMMLVPRKIAYPLEHQDIRTVYPDFDPWVASGGTALRDWYLRPNVGGICRKPKLDDVSWDSDLNANQTYTLQFTYNSSIDFEYLLQIQRVKPNGGDLLEVRGDSATISGLTPGVYYYSVGYKENGLFVHVNGGEFGIIHLYNSKLQFHLNLLSQELEMAIDSKDFRGKFTQVKTDVFFYDTDSNLIDQIHETAPVDSQLPVVSVSIDLSDFVPHFFDINTYITLIHQSLLDIYGNVIHSASALAWDSDHPAFPITPLDPTDPEQPGRKERIEIPVIPRPGEATIDPPRVDNEGFMFTPNLVESLMIGQIFEEDCKEEDPPDPANCEDPRNYSCGICLDPTQIVLCSGIGQCAGRFRQKDCGESGGGFLNSYYTLAIVEPGDPSLRPLLQNDYYQITLQSHDPLKLDDVFVVDIDGNIYTKLGKPVKNKFE